MAIGWLTVLKMVPWGDVVENAPKVAVGAKKLWNSVGKKSAKAEAAAAPEANPASADPGPTLPALQAQLAELRQVTAELQQHLLDSTALIQSLAEQNTQLVKRVELNRRRVLWLAAAVGLLLLAVLWQSGVLS